MLEARNALLLAALKATVISKKFVLHTEQYILIDEQLRNQKLKVKKIEKEMAELGKNTPSIGDVCPPHAECTPEIRQELEAALLPELRAEMRSQQWRAQDLQEDRNEILEIINKQEKAPAALRECERNSLELALILIPLGNEQNDLQLKQILRAWAYQQDGYSMLKPRPVSYQAALEETFRDIENSLNR